MRVTYIGHSTALIEIDGMRVLTDPLLRRRFLHVERRAPAVAIGSVRDVDVVLLSHIHHDHLDRPSLRRLAKDATLVVPRGAAKLVSRLGFVRLVELSEGERFRAGGIDFAATHADHRSGRLLPRGADAIGFTITASQGVYFAGDTDVFPRMRELAGRLDLALLPVWGWGTSLGPGHMDPGRAAEALTLLEPKVAIPIHWGTFYPLGLRRFRPQLLTEPPLAFAREAAKRAPGVEVRVLAPGQATAIHA